MSATSIKNGFLIGDSVPVSATSSVECQFSWRPKAETFSAQDMIKSRITQHGALAELEDLMNEIFSRRADHVPAMPYVSSILSRTIEPTYS
jgi:mediator of RNA polymerase II transcription subunit 12